MTTEPFDSAHCVPCITRAFLSEHPGGGTIYLRRGTYWRCPSCDAADEPLLPGPHVRIVGEGPNRARMMDSEADNIAVAPPPTREMFDRAILKLERDFPRSWESEYRRWAEGRRDG